MHQIQEADSPDGGLCYPCPDKLSQLEKCLATFLIIQKPTGSCGRGATYHPDILHPLPSVQKTNQHLQQPRSWLRGLKMQDASAILLAQNFEPSLQNTDCKQEEFTMTTLETYLSFHGFCETRLRRHK